MYRIIIQHAADKTLAPSSALLRKWAKSTLRDQIEAAEITIRLVSIEEMTQLNESYRHKKGPTNVLSFPFSMPNNIEIDPPILGDIVICSEVIHREAHEQGKTTDAHWAHMIVHGIFHLLGYDHVIDSEAEIMESLEIKCMQAMGFPNPYKMENI